jgi:hypothetical protein
VGIFASSHKGSKHLEENVCKVSYAYPNHKFQILILDKFLYTSYTEHLCNGIDVEVVQKSTWMGRMVSGEVLIKSPYLGDNLQ